MWLLARFFSLVRIGLLLVLLLASGELWVYVLLGFVLVGLCHYLLWGRSLSREAAAEAEGENADGSADEGRLWGNHGAGAFDADPHG